MSMNDPAQNKPPSDLLGGDAGIVDDGISTVRLEQPISSSAQAQPDDKTVITSKPPVSPPTQMAGFGSAEIGRALVGRRLDHFLLEEFIGGGGMGAVFKGADSFLGRTVAVKVLSCRGGNEDETARRFQVEAQSAARLDHQNIARVYHVGEDQGWHYIVFEYIEGENVRDLVLTNGPLALDEAVHYLLQIAEAMAHASGRSVVHRDIKPSNVLITPEKQAKLVDMGLARVHHADNSKTDLTASGVTLGTFDYISPEQARDPREADVRSDLYSLGCTFHFMLTGRPPFPEGTMLQKLLQHQGDEPPEIRQFRPNLPDEVDHIIKKLLAKKPQDRYQTPSELIGELLSLAQKTGLPSPASSALAPSFAGPRWWERHLPWAAPLAILLLVVVVLKVIDARAARTPLPIPQPLVVVPPEGSASDASSGNAQTEPASRSGNPSSTAGRGSDGPRGDGGMPVVVGEPATSSGAVASNLPASFGGPGDVLSPRPDQFDSLAQVRPGNNLQQVNDQQVSPRPGDESSSAGGTEGATPAITQAPYRILSGEEVLTASSLHDAVRAADNRGTIELRYNGPREERPIVLENQKLILRAGEGFSPIIRFRPATGGMTQSMIRVTGGELRLENVQIELDLPEGASSTPWSLVEAIEPERLRFEHTALTIRDVGAEESQFNVPRDVVFLRVNASPGMDAITRDEPLGEKSRVAIALRDTIIRGDATMLGGDALDSVELDWENGLLATSQRMLAVTADSHSHNGADVLEIMLDHVTALMRNGMISMVATEDQQRLPTTKMNVTNCILVTPGAPLILQSGLNGVASLQAAVQWNGDRNFYEGVDVFWRIRTPFDIEEPRELLWEDWVTHWGEEQENPQRMEPVRWREVPNLAVPLSHYTKQDVALDTTDPDNPALGAGSDGITHAGCDEVALPRLVVVSEKTFPIQRPPVETESRTQGKIQRSEAEVPDSAGDQRSEGDKTKTMPRKAAKDRATD